jgi:HlyD family secretion protein
MSVTAEIETRSRTNALTVPFASVTTRSPKDKKGGTAAGAGGTKTNSTWNDTNALAAGTNSPIVEGTNTAKADKKKEASKAVEVVFLMEGDHAKMVPVKIGISDDDYWEIATGLKEGDEVVSGSSKAINRDLEDGKKIKKGAVGVGTAKDGERKRGE